MAKKIKAKFGDLVTINIANIDVITKIDVAIPEVITNPVDILQFKLRDRNMISKDENIEIKIFDKKYVIKIVALYNENNKINQGMLFGSSLSRDINLNIV